MLSLREERFHRSRVMFVDDGTRVFVRKYVSIGHKQWCEEKGWDFDTILRGYIRDGSCYIYTKGDNFDFSLDIDITNTLKQLLEYKLIDMSTQIYGGVIKGDLGSIWKPKYSLGTVFEYFERKK